MVYLDMEVNGFHREDAYMAQIAAEVRRSRVKNPAKVKVEHLFIKFNRKGEPRRTPKEQAVASKSAWLAAVGLNGEGKPTGRVKTQKPRPERRRR